MEGITLKIELTKKQSLAHEKWVDGSTRFLLFGGGAGGGKTFWIATEKIIQAYQYPGIKSFIGRKELKRLMESTYLSFVKACQHYGVPKDDWKLNGQYNYIEFRNGSRIDLLDINFIPSDPLFERFGSTEYTNGFIEEAGESEFGAFDVLKSRVGRHRNTEFGIIGKIGLTANPSKNWLYRVFYKPFKAGLLPPEYAFVQSLYGDNPYTAQDYGEQLSHVSDKVQKERLMFGNWDYDADENALMNYDAILDLFSNTAAKGERFIIGDIARFGKDRTVVGVWHGLTLVKLFILRQSDVAQTAEFIRNLSKTEEIPYSQILIDEDGIGGGVVDILKGVKGFVANNAAYEGNFKNLKAECSYRLADYVNSHQIAIEAAMSEDDKQQLIEELGWIKSKDADKDGKRQIVPKEEVKEHLGRSPDLSDMLMMRMLFEVRKTSGKATVFVPKTGFNVNPALQTIRKEANVYRPHFG